MRPIIFRAKDENGIWRIGDLIHGVTYTFIRETTDIPPTFTEPGGDIDVTDHIVDSKTVGQFTGLYDSTELSELTDSQKEIYYEWTKWKWRGAPIFEGDLIKIQLPMGGFWGNVKKEEIGQVLYEADFGGFIVKWEYSKNQHHINLDCDIACESKIIGNIHDNPELIKR